MCRNLSIHRAPPIIVIKDIPNRQIANIADEHVLKLTLLSNENVSAAPLINMNDAESSISRDDSGIEVENLCTSLVGRTRYLRSDEQNRAMPYWLRNQW